MTVARLAVRTCDGAQDFRNRASWTTLTAPCILLPAHLCGKMVKWSLSLVMDHQPEVEKPVVSLMVMARL